MSDVRRYTWTEESYPPDGMELVAAADYDTLAAIAEVLIAKLDAQYQSCLVLIKSMQDDRDRIRELEAENARLISDGFQSAAYIIEMRDLRSRICELESALREIDDDIVDCRGEVCRHIARAALASQSDRRDKPDMAPKA